MSASPLSHSNYICVNVHELVSSPTTGKKNKMNQNSVFIALLW